jgi:hypothetical protein
MSARDAGSTETFELRGGGQVRVTSSSVEIQGRPLDDPLIRKAEMEGMELRAQADAGRFVCSVCGMNIPPGEGFTASGRIWWRSKLAPRRVHCMACSESERAQ